MIRTEPFKCPSCGALYQIVKIEAGLETIDHQLNCRACGAELNGRDGQFVLKYYLLRNPGQLRGR